MTNEFLVNGLRYAVVENARVYPLAYSGNSGSVRGGVLGQDVPPYALQYRGNGTGKINAMSRFRHTDPSGMLGAKEFKEVPGTSLYLGPLFKHFGHFLTEAFARSWYLDYGKEPWGTSYYLPQAESDEERAALAESGITGWRSTAFEMLGISDFDLVLEPMKFERLIIPEQGAILFSDFHHPSHLEFLHNRISQSLENVTSSKRIFFSRSKQGLSVAGELYIENFLKSQGYEIVIPELLSFEDQVKLASETAFAIGVQGSALHIFNILGISPAKVLTIKRQNYAVTQGFIHSMKPYVSSFDLISSAGRHQLQVGTELTFPNIAELLTKLDKFDPDIDVSKFSWNDFYESIIQQLGQNFKLNNISTTN